QQSSILYLLPPGFRSRGAARGPTEVVTEVAVRRVRVNRQPGRHRVLRLRAEEGRKPRPHGPTCYFPRISAGENRQSPPINVSGLFSCLTLFLPSLPRPRRERPDER